MDWYLIGGIDWFLTPANWLIVLQVAVGIGMVIFVHELGHFAVAKACGVKCEKFYLGFDIGGWKLFKYRWGETEYGIGVLPLGGYVKMLGQDDNPSKLHEETERAKLKAAEGGEAEEGDSVFDPRSYLAKSVPQRMAIISAGVIMNVIFAFVVATIAYGMGVQQVACVVGKLLPGEAAWRSGLHQGDLILSIGDVKKPTFQDLRTGVALGDNLDEGVDFLVLKPGADTPRHVLVVPEKRRRRPTIGINPNTSCILAKPAVSPYSALAQLDLGLMREDKIVAVNGEEVSSSVELDRAFSLHRGPATVTIEREIKDDGKDASSEGVSRKERFDIEIPPVPVRTVGLVMKMGKVTAIQQGSVAEKADIRHNDVIVSINGDKVVDPIRLPDLLSKRGGETVSVTIERGGREIQKDVVLDDGTLDDTFPTLDSPVALPALGLCYAIENEVVEVEPGGAAAKAGIKPGDKIAEAKFIAPDEEIQREKFHVEELQKDTKPLVFGEKRNWPAVFSMLQEGLPGTVLQLSLADGRTVKLEPQNAPDWFSAERGFYFQPELITQKAENFPEALVLGAREARGALSLVFRFIRKIFSGQVSGKDMGGPILIAEQAGAAASEGLSQFLVFLGMLSANLAVLNFLPIPMLDGGHMVFLAAEGVRGKPVSEQVVAYFQFAGLFFLASLMLFVLLLDVGLISRG